MNYAFLELLMTRYVNIKGTKFAFFGNESISFSESYIPLNVGNNSFAAKHPKAHTYLYAAPFEISQSFNDIVIGNKIAMQEVDEHGELITAYGIYPYTLSYGQASGVPMVLVDNHNMVYAAWQASISQGIFASPFTLVHIDAHKDNAQCTDYYPGITADKLTIANYIDAAQKADMLASISRLCESKDFETAPNILESSPRVLNIDIDIFMSEM